MFDVPNQIPPWLNPRETPFDALVKGAQAGSMIAKNMAERTQLGMEAEKQAALLPLQAQEAGLKMDQLKVQTAEQQIGLETMGQELNYQKQDLSGYQQYVQSLAAEPDPVKRADLAVPAFLSQKYNKQAEAVNRNMQDTAAVKDASDAKRMYGLAVTEQMKDLTKRAAAVQGLLDPADGLIITPTKNGGLPDVNQELLTKGELRLAEKKNKISALTPVLLDGNTVGFSSMNPTTGATTFHALPGTGSKLDAATSLELASLYRNKDSASHAMSVTLSDQKKTQEEKAPVLRQLQGQISLADDKIAKVLSRVNQGKGGSAPSKAQAMGAPPLAQRKAGEQYETPSGPMTWNGAGWEPAN